MTTTRPHKLLMLLSLSRGDPCPRIAAHSGPIEIEARRRFSNFVGALDTSGGHILVILFLLLYLTLTVFWFEAPDLAADRCDGVSVGENHRAGLDPACPECHVTLLVCPPPSIQPLQRLRGGAIFSLTGVR